MSQKEKVFADGFSFKRKENAPEFVVGRQSIKVDAAIAFLQTHQKNGWVNLDIKIAKGGNYYCELDTWEAPAKTEEAAPQATATTAKADDSLPF
jgi:thiol:disulfide interchange protein